MDWLPFVEGTLLFVHAFQGMLLFLNHREIFDNAGGLVTT